MRSFRIRQINVYDRELLFRLVMKLAGSENGKDSLGPNITKYNVTNV